MKRIIIVVSFLFALCRIAQSAVIAFDAQVTTRLVAAIVTSTNDVYTFDSLNLPGGGRKVYHSGISTYLKSLNAVVTSVGWDGYYLHIGTQGDGLIIYQPYHVTGGVYTPILRGWKINIADTVWDTRCLAAISSNVMFNNYEARTLWVQGPPPPFGQFVYTMRCADKMGVAPYLVLTEARRFSTGVIEGWGVYYTAPEVYEWKNGITLPANGSGYKRISMLNDASVDTSWYFVVLSNDNKVYSYRLTHQGSGAQQTVNGTLIDSAIYTTRTVTDVAPFQRGLYALLTTTTQGIYSSNGSKIDHYVPSGSNSYSHIQYTGSSTFVVACNNDNEVYYFGGSVTWAKYSARTATLAGTVSITDVVAVAPSPQKRVTIHKDMPTTTFDLLGRMMIRSTRNITVRWQ